MSRNVEIKARIDDGVAVARDLMQRLGVVDAELVERAYLFTDA